MVGPETIASRGQKAVRQTIFALVLASLAGVVYAEAKPMRIVALGDSLTAGYGVLSENAIAGGKTVAERDDPHGFCLRAGKTGEESENEHEYAMSHGLLTRLAMVSELTI